MQSSCPWSYSVRSEEGGGEGERGEGEGEDHSHVLTLCLLQTPDVLYRQLLS